MGQARTQHQELERGQAGPDGCWTKHRTSGLCVYMYMCTCVCVSVCAFLWVCVSVCTYVCMHVCVCVSMCLCMCGTHILMGKEAGGWDSDPNLEPLLVRMGDADSSTPQDRQDGPRPWGGGWSSLQCGAFPSWPGGGLAGLCLGVRPRASQKQ